MGQTDPNPRSRQRPSQLRRKRDVGLICLNLRLAYVVLFDSDGRAKVADFGLAKILDRDTSTTRSLVGVSAAVSSVLRAGDRSMFR